MDPKSPKSRCVFRNQSNTCDGDFAKIVNGEPLTIFAKRNYYADTRLCSNYASEKRPTVITLLRID